MVEVSPATEMKDEALHETYCGPVALTGWLIAYHALPAAAQARSPSRFTWCRHRCG